MFKQKKPPWSTIPKKPVELPIYMYFFSFQKIRHYFLPICYILKVND